jgi:shikimate dehydrogenase
MPLTARPRRRPRRRGDVPFARPHRAPVTAPAPPHVGRLVLVGHPVAHSLSPRFQNAALRAAGLALTYEAVDVTPDAVTATLDALARVGGAGNVTVPHKAHVAAACAELTPLAREVGAVNTFWHDADGRLVGDNTDVGGFAAAAHALLAPGAAPLRVALLGAGGSAAAVVAAVARWPGATLAIWSRTPARAAALAARAPATARAVAARDDALHRADLVVNATPLGLAADDPPPVPVEALPPGAAVLDLVYAPGRTRWVRAARAAGRPAEDGLAMLVEQGALAFARWFGREPDRDAMWRALAAEVAARGDP